VSSRTISVVGLGYVGLPVAVAFAEKGFEVIGFDTSQGRIKELSRGQDHTYEVNPSRLASDKLLFTNDKARLSDADFHIIAVPTPVDRYNRPNLKSLHAATQTVGEILKSNDIVVFESTVYPGCTEEECIPILEKISKLRLNKDFGVGYSPERINPGDKSRGFENITKVVSGSDSSTLATITETYGLVVNAGIFEAASIKVAEAAKIIENTQRDLNIALINELSTIFERLDIKTADVLEAAKTKWNFLSFEPGLVGGHCIGVDPYYLTFKAQQLGLEPNLILAGRKTNNNVPLRISEACIKWAVQNKAKQLNICVFGLTFKENVPDTRNSKVPEIVVHLEKHGHRVFKIDPYVGNASQKQQSTAMDWEYFEDHLNRTISANLDVVILAVKHDYFITKGWDLFAKFLHPKRNLVIDVKGSLDRAKKPVATTIWSL